MLRWQSESEGTDGGGEALCLLTMAQTRNSQKCEIQRSSLTQMLRGQWSAKGRLYLWLLIVGRYWGGALL